MPKYNLQGTIQDITISRNNTKIQLTRNNRRNNNHKEQCQDTTYRAQSINKLTVNNARNTDHKEQYKNKTYREQYKNKT